MLRTVYTGIVKNGRIVVDDAAELPEGAEVLVTPLEKARGSPQAVLAAVLAPPHLEPDDVDDLLKAIEEGKVPIRLENPLA